MTSGTSSFDKARGWIVRAVKGLDKVIVGEGRIELGLLSLGFGGFFLFLPLALLGRTHGQLSNY